MTAIIVSIVTLRRNTAQFRQQRLDARDDKLRAEIANLSAALTQRGDQLDIVVARSRELVDSITTDATSAEEIKGRYVWGNKAILAQEVSELYTRIGTHATTITMLTGDQVITDLVDRITEAAREERLIYRKRLTIVPPDERDELDRRSVEVRNAINVAREQLVALGRERLGTD
jgi:hypothetical protein